MEITNIEFYTFENEVWYREDNKSIKLTEDCREVVKEMIDYMSTIYPEAYEALRSHYNKLSWNISLQEYRIVKQFCKCNFGNIDMDNIDIDSTCSFHFENVSCPMKGECYMENIVCHPTFNSALSKAEQRVARLICNGKTNDEIAKLLFLSEYTVKNHLRNSYKKLNVSSRTELIGYCHKNNLFKN